MTDAPELIQRYFAHEGGPDVEAIVALFSTDAVVTDEGSTRRGLDQVREWRTEVASKYEYEATLLAVEPTGETSWLATARLEGNFPGGTVELRYDFVIDGGRISSLTIAP